jgi:DDE superfamily endonuclease
MGLDQHKRFHRYHRVLSHASWSSVKASRVLLGLLVEVFVPEGDPLIVGIDETLERRWGKKIANTRASTETRFVPLIKTS